MLKAFHLALFFSLLFQVVQAQQSIRVLENGEEKVLQFNTDTALNLSADLFGYYRDRGYLGVHITEEASNIPVVTTGELYSIQLVDTEALPSSIQALQGQVYNRMHIEEVLQLVVNNWRNQAYLEAKAVINAIEVDTSNKWVTLSIDVAMGTQVSVSELRIAGNQNLSDDYIRKVSRIQNQSPLNNQLIKQSRQQLIYSGLFEDVSEVEWVVNDDGEYSALIRVVELNKNSIEGLIGYVPGTDGKGQIVGDFKGTTWNVFTEGNSVDLAYQRVRPEVSRLKLSTHQYWVGQLPLQLGVEFSFFQNDSSFQQRSMDLNVGYFVNSLFSIHNTMYHRVVNVNERSVIVNDEDGKATGFEFGFTYSSVVNTTVPLSGNWLELLLGRYARTIDDENDNVLRYNYLDASFDNYTKVNKQQILATRLRGYYLIGDTFRETDLQRIGGANSIRGYAEEQFLVSQYLWGDLEYRWITTRQQSYFFLFAAGGYVERNRTINPMNRKLYSGGLGFNLATRIGRLNLTYALSAQTTIDNGKIHLRFTSKF